MSEANPTLGEKISQIAEQRLDDALTNGATIHSTTGYLAKIREALVADEDKRPGFIDDTYRRVVLGEHVERKSRRQKASDGSVDWGISQLNHAVTDARYMLSQGTHSLDQIHRVLCGDYPDGIAIDALNAALDRQYRSFNAHVAPDPDAPAEVFPSAPATPLGQPEPSNEAISLGEYLERHPEAAATWQKVLGAHHPILKGIPETRAELASEAEVPA